TPGAAGQPATGCDPATQREDARRDRSRAQPGDGRKARGGEGGAQRQPTAPVGQHDQRRTEPGHKSRNALDHRVTAKASATTAANHNTGLPPAAACSSPRMSRMLRYCSGTASEPSAIRTRAIDQAAGSLKSTGRDSVWRVDVPTSA